MTSALNALAEDPESFLEPPEGAERIANDRFCVVIGSERRWAGVCRLRVPDDPSLLATTVGEIRGLVRGIETVVWNVGSSARPADLAVRLRVLGLRDPDPPLDPLVAAMVLAVEPAPVDGIEVSRIDTFDDHLIGLEIMLAAARWSDEASAAERSLALQTFERRARRGGMQWLAYLDDTPLAWASAERASDGLYLAGGATLPDARGRGCYRALVRARWDEAARLGLQGLAVQAQYGSSAPILQRLGFAEVATIHTLQS